jgi:hypothetical protein
MTRLTFDKSAKGFVLSAFGKAVDEYGYIVEKAHRHTRVLTQDGMEIKKDSLAGIVKGSEIYYKSDVVSLIDLYDKLEQQQSNG